MYTKEDVKKIFDKDKILIGNHDEFPVYKAVEIFGKEAVEFAERTSNGYTNAYGIGDYDLPFLTVKGVEIAATYANICNARAMEAEKGGLI